MVPVELTVKYAPLSWPAQLGALFRVSRAQSAQYCQQHVTRDTTLHVSYMDTLYPRCYTDPRNYSACPTLTLREYCFGKCVLIRRLNLTRYRQR
jgi:hypothetical protein